jgi:hypothetical protein
MTTWLCEKFRPVTVDDNDPEQEDPARVFARRIARREYGRKGFVQNVRLDSRTMDGRCFNYEAFVGVSVKGDMHACSGRNVRFTIRRAET